MSLSLSMLEQYADSIVRMIRLDWCLSEGPTILPPFLSSNYQSTVSFSNMFDSEYLTYPGPTLLSFIYYSSFQTFPDRFPTPRMTHVTVQRLWFTESHFALNPITPPFSYIRSVGLRTQWTRAKNVFWKILGTRDFSHPGTGEFFSDLKSDPKFFSD